MDSVELRVINKGTNVLEFLFGMWNITKKNKEQFNQRKLFVKQLKVLSPNGGFPIAPFPKEDTKINNRVILTEVGPGRTWDKSTGNSQ